MKTERAIELLHRLQDEQFDGIHGDERREALEMAVRALKQNLVKESGDLVQDLVKDCISRQQAIDALDKHIDTFDAIDTNYLCGLRTAMSILKEMPSAQPETHDKRTETHECDLINRQQAIDAVVSAMIDGADAELVEGVMELLPSAQPVNYGSTKSDSSSQLKLNNDLISRQAVIDTVSKWFYDVFGITESDGTATIFKRLRELPHAQPERDIPVKPIKTTDKAWGIPKRQAVCPNCDYYLGHVAFLGDYKGKRVTYCETCGQAIDWEGWNFDE